MPTSVLEPETSANTAPSVAAASRLRETTAAVRLSFTWFGSRKTLSPEQKAEAADTFGAEGTFVSAAKKLLDTKHPAYKQVTNIRGQIVHTWKHRSLPFPEPGIRLIRQQEIASFQSQMTNFQGELVAAVEVLDEHYSELRSAARQRLGRLYSPADYPASLQGLFAVSWDFPSVEPPEYLRQLNPALYEAECQRVQARFDEAVQLAEQTFLAELNQLVSHLGERLSGHDDGRPKVFRDSAVENLTEFFSRFRQLNIRSNDQLEQLVDQATRVIQGVRPEQLRNDASFRQQVGSQLSGIQSVLDGLLVDRPRRTILRRTRSPEA